MTDKSAAGALRAALVLLDAHSLIDPEDGNYRVEGGTWEAVRAALAASATDEERCGCTMDAAEPGPCPYCHHREHGSTGCLAASATDEGPNGTCCENGDFGDGHECLKSDVRPAVPALDGLIDATYTRGFAEHGEDDPLRDFMATYFDHDDDHTREQIIDFLDRIIRRYAALSKGADR